MPGPRPKQKEHLAQFGINEDYLGVPVLSTMDVVEVATLEDGFPVYCDKNAYEADGIILFNKIKPHTHFKYKHESGLLKMICIGCGKHKGASTFHAGLRFLRPQPGTRVKSLLAACKRRFLGRHGPEPQ